MSIIRALTRKIENGTAKIGVLGLGYVGLPLSLLLATKFSVMGYDPMKTKIDTLLKGKSYIKNTEDETIQQYVNKSFFPTDDLRPLKECDFIIICVPTPLTESGNPDLSYIKTATEEVSKNLRKGQFVVLESTTYPGTTEEVVLPLLEKTGLRAGVDFGLAYSPERVNPGTEEHVMRTTPKVVGGINEECTTIAKQLYGAVFDAAIITVSDCKTAEATKMMENIFREVNIALVNELALIFEKMGISTWEVIDAASTKPFAFLPHYPGPGVGGHCIPLDPFYLSYKAKQIGFIPRFIELSGEINEFMKTHTVNLIREGLKRVSKRIAYSKITILGLAYKKDVDDVRESPAVKIIEELVNLGAKIKVYDPYAKLINTRYGVFSSENSVEDAVKNADCAVFVTDHTQFKNLDPKFIMLMKNPIIVDCRNIFDEQKLKHVIYYGIGKPNHRMGSV